jgi:hypothetical protein
MSVIHLAPERPPRVTDDSIDWMISRTWQQYLDGELTWRQAGRWDEILRTWRVRQ